MKFLFCCAFFLLSISTVLGQQGLIAGAVFDEKGKALQGASVHVHSFSNTTKKQIVATDKDGHFLVSHLPTDFYRLRISFVGLTTVIIDSIHVRSERSDFNLGEIVLKQSSAQTMEEVIVYAEKPLIQSKDGNITFNAGESALSQGSSASDLLANAPLVTKDPNGKILVRGKEPKILIDDKPVNLSLQQMQDLLESIPGSSIEKIEVLTNPPPQYANEEGGVINIVTKKGVVGMSGKLTAFAGTRGEVGGNGNFNYRKQKMVLNVHAGVSRNNFEGNGYSLRQNIYSDSSTRLNTNNHYTNQNVRPNARLNFDYEFSKQQSLNVVLQYNGNEHDNENNTEFRNLNRFEQLYRLSHRLISSDGNNSNPSLALTYTLKTKKPGEALKLHTNLGLYNSDNNRLFYQQFLNPDYTYTGVDSTQVQITDNATKNYFIQLNYDKPLANKKTSISFGASSNGSRSDVQTDAAYKRRADGKMLPLELLSNHFLFTQNIRIVRSSMKHLFSHKASFTGGISAEQTRIGFNFFKNNADTANHYWSLLPFANLNKGWKDVWNLSLKYRRTIRRPGINELNPTIDFSDPYNIRFGNPQLEASTVHNFDVVAGRNKNAFYVNLGIGYNVVQDIFSQIRSLLPDGKTEITWENISGRKEYEISSWTGYTINKKIRFNLSASYTHNQYNAYDKQVRKFRDGGSLSSNLNTNYSIKDLYTFTGNFTLNRFANPQGNVRSNMSMNLGVQGKFFNKKMIVSLNAIDPFLQQQNRTFTYGRNFILENYSVTQTKNYRLTVGYNLNKTVKKNNSKQVMKARGLK